jgi:hypothetical protein
MLEQRANEIEAEAANAVDAAVAPLDNEQTPCSPNPATRRRRTTRPATPHPEFGHLAQAAGVAGLPLMTTFRSAPLHTVALARRRGERSAMPMGDRGTSEAAAAAGASRVLEPPTPPSPTPASPPPVAADGHTVEQACLNCGTRLTARTAMPAARRRISTARCAASPTTSFTACSISKARCGTRCRSSPFGPGR